MEVGIIEGLRAVAVVEAAVRSAARQGEPIEIEHVLSESGATAAERTEVLGV
jgi:N-dimethylarginine dimethylaminohydrolase